MEDSRFFNRFEMRLSLRQTGECIRVTGMKLTRSKKPAIFLLIIIFLMVGGATAFFYVINHATDPVVEADINAHFADLLDNEPAPPDFSSIATDDNTTDIRLFSTRHEHEHIISAAQEKNSSQKKTGKKSRKVWSKKRPAHRSNVEKTFSSRGIRKIAPGTWLVSSKRYTHAQNNIMDYAGEAHAALVEDSNGPIGFGLHRIKKGSYLHDIGLREQDVLIAINGHPLNSIENVTLAIASFKNATRFRLDLLRWESKRSFYYKVVSNSP